MTDDSGRRQGLALVGLRGTGKSTVGKILAERVGLPFVDADAELETRVGRPIAAIFSEFGEPAFRDWEERILDDLTARPASVLATGGGVILRAANRSKLRSFGFVVWLRAVPALLAERLLGDPRGLVGRPALTAAGTLEELASVLEARTPLYEEVADAAIDTSHRSAAEVAEAILDVWNPHGND